MALELSVELSEDLTWDELVSFVEAARSYVNPSDKVDFVTDENSAEWAPRKLRAKLPAVSSAIAPITVAEAAVYRDVIQRVLDAGDARGVTDELTKLRDALG